jgi:HSP20 family molecular chaperone IbpA
MAEETKQVTQEVRRIVPPVDIYESGDDIVLLADMPGVTKDNLSLDVDKGELTIRGTFLEQETEGEKLLDECLYGEYYRTFTLADAIDTEKISAKLENGVLSMTLPKREKVKPKKIAIETE